MKISHPKPLTLASISLLLGSANAFGKESLYRVGKEDIFLTLVDKIGINYDTLLKLNPHLQYGQLNSHTLIGLNGLSKNKIINFIQEIKFEEALQNIPRDKNKANQFLADIKMDDKFKKSFYTIYTNLQENKIEGVFPTFKQVLSHAKNLGNKNALPFKQKRLYQVSQGDTLATILKKEFNTYNSFLLSSTLKLNSKIQDKNKIYAGEWLLLPDSLVKRSVASTKTEEISKVKINKENPKKIEKEITFDIEDFEQKITQQHQKNRRNRESWAIDFSVGAGIKAIHGINEVSKVKGALYTRRYYKMHTQITQKWTPRFSTSFGLGISYFSLYGLDNGVLNSDTKTLQNINVRAKYTLLPSLYLTGEFFVDEIAYWKTSDDILYNLNTAMGFGEKIGLETNIYKNDKSKVNLGFSLSQLERGNNSTDTLEGEEFGHNVYLTYENESKNGNIGTTLYQSKKSYSIPGTTSFTDKEVGIIFFWKTDLF